MNTTARTTGTGLLVLFLTLTAGTAVGTATTAAMAQQSDDWGTSLPKGLILADAPTGAKTLRDALVSAKVGESIVLRGRIAAGKDAFKEGRAAFALVQPAPAPAQADLSAHIQVVDEKGNVLKADLKNKRGLRSGAEIIIVGKITATDGVLVLGVNATGIYVMPASLPKDLFLAAEPKDAKPVEEIKKIAKKGDIVVMRGRVGGSKEPFVAGRAVFTLMGPGLKACSDNPDDKCSIPWDYCCETKKAIAEHSATVQIVESDGSPIKAAIKGQNGVKELSDLIVVGKVVQADGKTLIVSATGVFVVEK